MANFLTPPSAPLLLLLLLLFSVAATISTPASAIPTESLDSILSLLRRRGHALFANAISTSDLLFDLLSLPSFTLLAPSNPSLFALDMIQSPPYYLSSLRLHVVPFRLNLLQTNTSAATTDAAPLLLHTLIPSRDLAVTRDLGRDIVLIDGVEVVFPPLFYTGEVAVYRLRGMLLWPDLLNSSSSSSATPVPVRPRHHPPRNHANRTVFLPSAPRSRPVPFNRTILPLVPQPQANSTNRTTSPPPPPVNWTIWTPVPANDSSTNRRSSPPSSVVNWTIWTPLPENGSILAPPVDENSTTAFPEPGIGFTPVNFTNRTGLLPATNNGTTNISSSVPDTTIHADLYPPVGFTSLGGSYSAPSESPRNPNGEEVEGGLSAGEQCGPLDEKGELQYCALSDGGEIGLGHVSGTDDSADYMIRHFTTEYDL